MNKLLLVTLAFAAGLGTGYFAANKVLDSKYEELLDEEIESIRDRATKKAYEDGRKELGEYAKAASEYKAEYVELDTEEEFEIDEELAEAFLSAMTSEGVPIDGPDPGAKIRKQTYQISEEDFHTSALMNGKITVNYYNGDSTFVDSNDEVETDIEGLLGVTDLLMLFNGESEVAYVRNEIIGVDYEILWNDCSYSEWLSAVKGD